MKHKMIAVVLALTLMSWAQTTTQTAPAAPQQSAPAEKSKCPCCDKMASGDTKDAHACCMHHDDVQSGGKDVQSGDKKAAASCCAGKEGMSCCAGKEGMSCCGGKDAKSCMKNEKDKAAGSCCGDSCGKDKTAGSCCGDKCGKDCGKGCCCSENKTEKPA